MAVAGVLLSAISADAQAPGFLQTNETSARLVSRRDFAKNLIKKLGLEEPDAEHGNGDPIRLLQGNNQINIKPANYSYASPNIREGVTLVGGKPQTYLHARGTAASVIYRFTTSRSGEVEIGALVKGGTQIWSLNGEAPVAVREDGTGNGEAPPFRLKAGTHELRVSLPPGGSIGDINVETPCMNPILPVNNGDPNAPLTYGEKTTAMVRVLDIAYRLPDLPGSGTNAPAEQSVSNAGAIRPVSAVNERGEKLQGVALNKTATGSDSGKIRFKVTAPRAGLYQIQASISGTGKPSWFVNGCKAGSASVRTPDNSPVQVTIGTVELAKGINNITVQAGPNLKFFGISLKQKQENTSAYYQVAQGAGLKEGAPMEPVDEGGLAANLTHAAFVRQMELFRQEDRDSLFGSDGSMNPLKNEPPEFDDFVLNDPGTFVSPVSPYTPAALP